jgi:hypothetical protein
MPPHLLLHARHVLQAAFTSASKEGGAWAWAGLLAGGLVGYLVVFSGDGPWTEGIVALGILGVGSAAVTGACIGALGKVMYDHLAGSGSPPQGL